MKKSIESVLGNDHESLDQLFTELDKELANLNIARWYELLDLFWARLAVHIRAENLHLFPALARAPASVFTGRGNLPTHEEAHNTLSSLGSDHDFFMKELAKMIKTAREIRAGLDAGRAESEELIQRFAVIRKRLETHNLLEEKRVYTWPALLFDEETIAGLCDRLKCELDTLPPRFSVPQ